MVPTWIPAESTMETTENRPRQTPSTEAQLPLKHKVFTIRSQSAIMTTVLTSKWTQALWIKAGAQVV